VTCGDPITVPIEGGRIGMTCLLCSHQAIRMSHRQMNHVLNFETRSFYLLIQLSSRVVLTNFLLRNSAYIISYKWCYRNTFVDIY